MQVLAKGIDAWEELGQLLSQLETAESELLFMRHSSIVVDGGGGRVFEIYPGNPREADHETVKELFRKIMA